MSPPINPPDPLHHLTLRLPRILCLHGGGTNARIFKAQCRILRSQLSSHFRLVFAEAPFSSQPGPDVVSVYKEFGPFKRWLRSGPDQPEIHPDDAVEAIEDSLFSAMDADDALGATGDWVGLLGFSQGAKMAASLLFRQQVRTEKLGKYLAGTDYRFAVLMAGRGPLVTLDRDLTGENSALVDASEVGLSELPTLEDLERGEHVLRLPTVHVHGLKDVGLPLHRQLLDDYCEAKSARLVQWEGNHRVPIRTKDVAAVVDQVMLVAKQTDAI